MICSDCKCSYLSKPDDRPSLKTLSGLCKKCGTQPRHAQFLSSFANSAAGTVLSCEIILLIGFISGWQWYLYLSACLGVVYFMIKRAVNNGEMVTFSSDAERRKATWSIKLAGSLCGFGCALILFLVVMGVNIPQ